MSPAPMAFGMERLKEVWSRRKWPAIVAFTAVVAAGGGLTLGLPNVYRATASIRVEPPPGVGLPGPGEVETRLQLATQQVLSRARLADLARRFRLYEDLRGKVSEEELLKRVRRDIRVELKEPDTLGQERASATAFTVAFRGRDASVVSEAANTIASWYVEEDVRFRSGAADVLRGQVEDVRKRLEEQDRRLADFRNRHGGELPQQLEINLSTLQRIDSDMRLAGDSRARAQERRATLLAQLSEASDATTRDSESPEARLARLRQELAEQRRAYTERYPDVGRLVAEIAALERKVEAKAPPAPPVEGERSRGSRPLLEAALREVEGEIQSFRRQEEALRAESAAYRQRLEAAPRRGQAFEEMARDYETTKTLYNGLLKRYEEARLASGAAVGGGDQSFRLLEPALPPQDAAAPNRLRLALMTLLLGAGLAGLLVALLEQADTSFHSVDDLRTFTRVPVLVSVPRIPENGLWSQLQRGLVAVSLVVGLAAVAGLSYRYSGSNDQVISLVTRGR